MILISTLAPAGELLVDLENIRALFGQTPAGQGNRRFFVSIDGVAERFEITGKQAAVLRDLLEGDEKPFAPNGP